LNADARATSIAPRTGSLVTAVASYCQTKAAGGKWLLRIEDLDTPRVIDGCADNILRTLDYFGFEWDGEVLYQSQRFDQYQQILQQLIDRQLIYACECSRRSIQQASHRSGPLGVIYPGNCLKKPLSFDSCSLRLKVEPAGSIEFYDQHYGNYCLDLPTEVGDIVLRRSDGIYAYHLAVVADDAFQNINQIVRGADLLHSTCIHLYLNELLGYPDAAYTHIPLIKNSDGEKLSKQTGAEALSIEHAGNQLLQALQVLGQPMPKEMIRASVQEILQYAVSHWDANNIPADR
jgi:glutamyl-Q tRNA(Asp) synthetase